VACRRRAEAVELMRLRVVDDGAGSRLVTGAGPGRGAWVCPGTACFDEVVPRNRLARALRRSALPDGADEVREALSRPSERGRDRPAG
jgi:predicted RNA-binding protein YlxR (DUF448 family)